MRVTRWTRTSALAGAAVLLLATAGCSDDSSGSSDGDDDASAESSDLESPDAYDCVLPSATIGAITDFDFTGVEPNGGGIGGTSGSLAWDGCEYETDGDASVELSIIVDESGAPDVASYDAFAADAVESDESDPAGDTEIGEGSFFDLSGDLYVRTADSTVSFSLIGSDAGDPSPEDLEAIALGVIEADGSEDDCESLPGQVPVGYLPQDNISTGTSSDGTNDFVTCRFSVYVGGPDGVEWDLEIAYSGDPEVFDRLAAETDQSGSAEKVHVDDLGDSAVRYRDALYFKSGSTAYAVEGEDDAGDPLAFEVLEEIAQAVVDQGDDPGASDATDSTSGATEDSTEPTEPTEPTDEPTTDAGGTVSDDFCTNIQAMLDSLDGLFGTFEADDYEAYVAWAESFVPLGEAIVDTAPAELQADAVLAVTPILDLATAVATLDPADTKAIDKAFTEAFTQSPKGVDKAGNRILEHCGIDPDTLD